MEVAEIDVVANTTEASKEIADLKKQVENLSQEVVDSNKATQDSLNALTIGIGAFVKAQTVIT